MGRGIVNIVGGIAMAIFALNVGFASRNGRAGVALGVLALLSICHGILLVALARRAAGWRAADDTPGVTRTSVHRQVVPPRAAAGPAPSASFVDGAVDVNGPSADLVTDQRPPVEFHDEPSRRSPVYVSSLPSDAQRRLADASRTCPSEGDTIAVPLSSTTGAKVAVGAAATGLVLLFGLALWTGPWTSFTRPEVRHGGPWPLLLLPTTGAAAMLVFSLAKIVAQRRSRLRPALVATPLALVRTGLDHEPVEIHEITSLRELALTDRFTNQQYVGTDITARFRTGLLSAHVRSRSDAERIASHVANAPHRIEQWLRDGTLEHEAERHDWLGLLRGSRTPGRQHSAPAPPAPWTSRRSALWTAAGAVTATAVGAAWCTNVIGNEVLLWRRARTADTPAAYSMYVSQAPFGWSVDEARERSDHAAFRLAHDSIPDLRAYLRTPGPRAHVAEAAARIRGISREALAAYPPSTGAPDPEAAAALKAAVALAVATDSPDVVIELHPPSQSDLAELDVEIAALAAPQKVHPIAPAFSANRSRPRTCAIEDAVREAIHQVLPRGVLVLTEGRRDAGRPVVVVSYGLAPSGDLFAEEDPLDRIRRNASPGASEALRSIQARIDGNRRRSAVQTPAYPGVRFEFRVQILVPGRAGEDDRTCDLRIDARPAPRFTVERDVRQVPRDSAAAVLEAMTDTAIAEFGTSLARRLGAGQR